MTRLITDWIKDMEQTLDSQSKQLKEKTGLDFIGLAAAAAGKSLEEIADAARTTTVAVVPVTAGLGIIGSFAQAAAVIISHAGFQTFVTNETDVAGLHEAAEKKADIVFMADDNRYIAMNLCKKPFAASDTKKSAAEDGSRSVIVENDFAVAKGYVLLLDAMAKKQHGHGLSGEDVLLLGYGRVGKRMEQELLALGAAVTIFDSDPAIQQQIANRELPNRGAHNAGQRPPGRDPTASEPLTPNTKPSRQALPDLRINNFTYIADATDKGSWITREMLAPDALFAAPGIPFSLNEEAEIAYQRCSIHDMLEIGTVTMLALAL